MSLILVIDDEPGIIALLRTRLTQAGHEVAEADEGIAGIKKMEERPAELVFCDLNMPNKAGLNVVQELRRRFPSVIIVVMSGGVLESSEALLPIARALGADWAVQKPFHLDQVVDLIASLLS